MACERTGFDKIEKPSQKAEIEAILLETVLVQVPQERKIQVYTFGGVVC